MTEIIINIMNFAVNIVDIIEEITNLSCHEKWPSHMDINFFKCSLSLQRPGKIRPDLFLLLTVLSILASFGMETATNTINKHVMMNSSSGTSAGEQDR